MLTSEKGRAQVSLLIWAGWDNAFSTLEDHAPGVTPSESESEGIVNYSLMFLLVDNSSYNVDI